MLNTYDNFTLSSIFWPETFIKKNMQFNINYIVSKRLCSCIVSNSFVVDIEVHVFLLIKAS